MAATGGPAVAQVKRAAGCSVNDRESPWVTLLTGMWRARGGLMAASAEHLIRRYLSAVQHRPNRSANWQDRHPPVRPRSLSAGNRSRGWLPTWLPSDRLLISSGRVRVALVVGPSLTGDRSHGGPASIGSRRSMLWSGLVVSSDCAVSGIEPRIGPRRAGRCGSCRVLRRWTRDLRSCQAGAEPADCIHVHCFRAHPRCALAGCAGAAGEPGRGWGA